VLGEGYKYVFWMRTCRYVYEHPVLKPLVYLPVRVILRHYRFRLGSR
jgi:hypothetical protein